MALSPIEYPLKNKKVIVTRAQKQSVQFCLELEKEKAIPLRISTIDIHPPSDWSSVDKVISQIHEYQYVIFTSQNAVHFFLDRFSRESDQKNFDYLKVAAIGPKTLLALSNRGVSVDIMPEKSQNSETLLRKLLERKDIFKCRILLPQAEKSRGVIAAGLREIGAQIDELTVYQTVPSKEGLKILESIMSQDRVDWLTFASPSAVHSFFALTDEKKIHEWIDRESVRVASIGPITSQSLIEHKISSFVQARQPTIEALIEQIKHSTQ